MAAQQSLSGHGLVLFMSSVLLVTARAEDSTGKAMAALERKLHGAWIGSGPCDGQLTLKADGTPQLSPVTVGVDDDAHVVISTRETAYKVRNVRRDPHRRWIE